MKIQKTKIFSYVWSSRNDAMVHAKKNEVSSSDGGKRLTATGNRDRVILSR